MNINDITGFINDHGAEIDTQIVIRTQDEFASRIAYFTLETDMRTGETVVVIHPNYVEQLDTELHPLDQGENS